MFKKLTLLGLLLGGSCLAACPSTTTPSAATQQLINIAGQVVAVECNAATLSTVTATTSAILNVLAPSNSTAQAAVAALEANQAIAASLCPGLQAITVAVGNLPSGTPTVVSVPPASGKLGAAPSIPVIWLTPKP